MWARMLNQGGFVPETSYAHPQELEVPDILNWPEGSSPGRRTVNLVRPVAH